MLAITQSSPYLYCTHKLFSWNNTSSDLETKIKLTAAKNILNDEEKKDLKFAFKKAQQWTWSGSRMRSLLKSVLKETHIHQILEIDLNERDFVKKLEYYLTFLDKSALLNLSEFRTTQHAAARFCSHGLIKKSILKSNLEKEGKAIFKEYWIEVKYFFHKLLDIFIAILGINELKEEKHTWHSDDRMNEYDALRKFEVYSRLIGIPAILFGFIFTFVQLQLIALAITAIAITSSIALLILYQRHGKPCPKDHFGLKNLNIEILRSQDPIYPREEILDKIEKAFKQKKGVILVGEPGVGKSSIPKSLVEEILEGRRCTFITDPQVFSCGASKFKSEDMRSLTFDSIAERFRRHNEQVIFFFDEFHAMFDAKGLKEKDQKNNITIFADEFRYIIGATTKQEYDQFVKDQHAIMDRRFIKIDVGALDDQKLHVILDQFLKIKYPKIIYDDKVLPYIIANATKFKPKTSQVDAAISLLNLAVEKLDAVDFKNLELQIQKLEFEKKLLEQKLLHAEIGKDEPLIKEYKDKQEEISIVNRQLSEKKDRVERLRHLEKGYVKFLEESYRMSDSKGELKENSPLERKWIELLTKIEILKKFIAKERAALHLPECLNQTLIDTLI